MTNFETTEIGNYVINRARLYENRKPITLKSIQDKFNTSMEFLKENTKQICQWLIDSIDVIDVDITEDGDYDIIVKKRVVT